MKRIIISPYSRGKDNPKNYPYWNVLITLLKSKKYRVIQIGTKGEEELAGCEYQFDLALPALEALVKDVGYFIAVDNFFPHMAYVLGIKGLVLWGPSNPTVYGHPTHTNVIKDVKLCRANQFGFFTGTTWEHALTGWVSPEDVMKEVK